MKNNYLDNKGGKTGPMTWINYFCEKRCESPIVQINFQLKAPLENKRVDIYIIWHNINLKCKETEDSVLYLF